MEQAKGKRQAIAASLYNPYNRLAWVGYAPFYAFEVATLDWKQFEGIAGVFMYAQNTGKTMNRGRPGKPRPIPLWHALYVSHTDDFSKELPSHPKWQEAANLGATHVILMILEDENSRVLHVRNWVSSFLPPMNEGDYIPSPGTCGCGIYAGMEV